MKKVFIIIGVVIAFFVLNIAGRVAVNQIFNHYESKKRSAEIRGGMSMSMLVLYYNTYKSTYHTAPKSWDDLIHTPDNEPLINGVDINEKTFIDPWKSTYRLLEKDGSVFIISNGPDRKPDTDDDIIEQI